MELTYSGVDATTHPDPLYRPTPFEFPVTADLDLTQVVATTVRMTKLDEVFDPLVDLPFTIGEQVSILL